MKHNYADCCTRKCKSKLRIDQSSAFYDFKIEMLYVLNVYFNNYNNDGI